MPDVAESEALISVDALDAFIIDALVAGGSSPEQARSVGKALSSASLRGVDSHGVRLLPHYVAVLEGGRISGAPQLGVRQTSSTTAIVDADNGFGHHASYRAVEEACALAQKAGMAAVSVINSSHFGAAGCYALHAAQMGLVGFAFCNSDSFVLPFSGTVPFHGTNPIAFAAPVRGRRPYLVDMATSIVPWNRIQDYRSKGLTLPEDVAVDGTGAMTVAPEEVQALLPMGGTRFGYKGAALAGMMEILSAVMTGMAHCSALLPMVGEDMATPRRLGHFFIVINPEMFVTKEVYDSGMAAYLADIRRQPATSGETVMAPGDREWATEDQRAARGIPVAAALLGEYRQIAARYGLRSIG